MFDVKKRTLHAAVLAVLQVYAVVGTIIGSRVDDPTATDAKPALGSKTVNTVVPEPV
jgi:hypothetical protein